MRPAGGRAGPATAALVALAAGLLAACSTGTGDLDPARGFAGFPTCEGLTTITADPALYRDEPTYGNAEALVAQVRDWAAEQPGFVELWLDREHHGWVTVGFAGDPDLGALQSELAARFPGEGIVAVALPFTYAELATLGDRVTQDLAAAGAMPTGWAPDPLRGVLSLQGVPATPQAEATLEQYSGEPICVDVVDPSQVVPEGPQQTEGAGWRLLGHAEGAGEVYRTDVATTDAQLATLWAESGLGGDPPAIDWETEIAVWFGAVYGSGCPVRLDGVMAEAGTLHAVLVIPGSGPDTACNADANPHSFVVAVQRSVLPEGPFQVQLGATAPPPGAPEERTIVDVDLTAPGSTATDAQVHRDPDTGAQEPELIADGYDHLPDQGVRYVWHTRPECDGIVLGPIDASLWRLADGEAEWDAADGDEVAIHPVDEDLLVVSTPGSDYAFTRAPDSVCAD